MSKRSIEVPAAFVLVVNLVFAPSVVRAQQHLDYRPVTPVFSFSRGGEPPPPKTNLDRPGQIIARAAFLALPPPAASMRREAIEDVPPVRASADSSPDPQRGPPPFLHR